MIPNSSPESYLNSLKSLFASLPDSAQKHRLSLHPYMSTKSQAPHRKLFEDRRRHLNEKRAEHGDVACVDSHGRTSVNCDALPSSTLGALPHKSNVFTPIHRQKRTRKKSTPLIRANLPKEGAESPTPDEAWLLGDLSYISMDTEHRPITCSLSNQSEVRSRCGMRQFHRLLSESCVSVFFQSSEEKLREYVLHPEKRTQKTTLTNGIYGLRQTMESIATGERKLTGGAAGILVCHYALCEDSDDCLLRHVSNVQEANVFIVYFLIKGSAGTGPSSKSKKCSATKSRSTTKARCKYSSNTCVRLSMLVDRNIVSRSFSNTKDPATKSLRKKLGELQFVQRLLEEESWILFEAVNTGTVADRGRSKDIKYPLYLSYARDAVSIELQFKDSFFDTFIKGISRTIVKREWFFPSHCRPSNANQTDLRVGLTQYLGLYTPQEQDWIDSQIECMNEGFELDMLDILIFPPHARFASLSRGYAFEWVCADANSRTDRNQEAGDVKLNGDTSGSTDGVSNGTSNTSTHPVRVTLAHPQYSPDLTGSSYPKIRINYNRVDLMKIFQGISQFQDVFQLDDTIPREALEFLDSSVAPRVESSRMAAHRTFNAGGLLRTKFFCEMNYLWTHEQLAEVGACWAHYTRRSILPIPEWICENFIARLCAADIIPPDFVKMVACNIYETGDLGLSSHFDDPIRFSPPIVSYQPFTEKRLSFGPVDSGMTNPLFCISMPRGSILVMEKDSYAIAKVKHGVRKQDLTAKSGALIFRNIPQSILTKADEHTEQKAHEECNCSSHSTGHGTTVRVKRAPHTPRTRKKRDRSSPMTMEPQAVGSGESVRDENGKEISPARKKKRSV
mmetsp:Transcript_8594/g.31789  ORF Transcript_8594/g.31789 Transcript_8594/m.31789 type:complete len:846 (-) Transcript_8594:3041-5578(-)